MKSDYKKLKKKILLHVLVITGVVLILWFGFQFFFVQGVVPLPFNSIEMDKSFEGDVTNSNSLEFNAQQMDKFAELFQQRQRGYLVTIGLLALLMTIFYYLMMRLTKYFKEVSSGVHQLLEYSNETITLSPEMDFMQAKLNDVRMELIKRASEAKDAEQRKNELIAYLAHDIRTPLTSILGYLKLLEEEPDMPLEQRSKYLGVTLDSAERLDTLVNQFFEITRFNLQEINLDMQEFNLTFMLQQLADSFYPILESEDKRITIHAPEHLMIQGDTDKLVRVFRNIVKNASVFSDKGSVIEIEVKEGDTEVIIVISDTGSVIPQEALQIIFDKFYRLDNARGAKTGGAGLGLAIAKEIVMAHGGTISASSTQTETAFIISLPKSQPCPK